MRLNRRSRGSGSGSGIGKILIILVLGILIAGGAYFGIVFYEKEIPTVTLSDDIKYLGKTTKFSLSAKDSKSGLRSIKLAVLQGEKEFEIVNEKFPRRGYSGKIGPESYTKDVEFNLNKSGLKDGEAEIVIAVADYSFRGFFSGNVKEIKKKVAIDTKPPKVRVIHSERYISPGGSGIAIYQIQGDAARHGADFAGHFHKGYPVGDGRDDVFISYFALPYDAVEIGKSAISAEDAAGNKSSFAFSPILKDAKQKADRINVGDGFLNEKIPEFQQYYPEMKGDMVEKYLYTNRDVRKANNKKIYELCQNPSKERLWKDRFLRMSGASRAGYADHRTYFYNGKEIDRQVHLGMDIASTRKAEVRAANKGKVTYAGYLGIYGNMVMLDHGQGVFSLYSHMSNIQVAVGDMLETNTVLGHTGKSGMAGGDHLHFSILINGIFVTPIEWWDQQWINVTIDEPLVDSKF